VIHNTVNPEWGPFSLCTYEVGGLDGEFTFICYDWEKDGAHVEIGRFTTTLREFTFGPFQFPLINIEKAGRYCLDIILLAFFFFFFCFLLHFS
jgi:hypothetical protein